MDRCEPRDLTPGVLDGIAKRAFKFGDCDILAVALHDATGWPIVKITDKHNVFDDGEAGGGSALHYMVRHPDGGLVDVDGLHSEDEILDEYYGMADADDDNPDGEAAVGTTTRAEAIDEYYERKDGKIPVALASSFVRHVLDLVGRQRGNSARPNGGRSQLSGLKDKLYWRRVLTTGLFHCFKRSNGSRGGTKIRCVSLCERYEIHGSAGQASRRPEPAFRCGTCDAAEMRRRGWDESGPTLEPQLPPTHPLADV